MPSKRIEALHVRPPAALAYLWDWFKELSMGRPRGGIGVAPIPSVEIAAWGSLMRVRLTSFELDILRRLDRAVIATKNKERSNVG